MAYVNEGDAAFRHTTTSGFMTLLGKVSLLIEKLITREVIQADANNTPMDRPVDEIDARVTAESLDTAMAVSETTAASNLTSNFSTADGGTGSIVIGPLVASSVQHTGRRKMGGHTCQQTLELKGSALTYTPTV